MLLGVMTDQRLAPTSQRLPAQHVKILRGRGGLANLDVVARRKLKVSLNARARMLRTLPFVSVRKKHHDAGEQIPFVFACRDELVDDDLRAVGEITELRFPQNERFGIIAAESVFKAQNGRLGKRRIVNLEPCRFRSRDVRAGHTPLRFRYRSARRAAD